jgi:hypothetical protein
VDHHRKPFSECLKKAFNLPKEWELTNSSVINLCIDKGLLEQWATPGVALYQVRFVGSVVVHSTENPAEVLPAIILSDYVNAVRKNTPEDPQ